MTALLYILAALGAYVIARQMVAIIRTLRADFNSKPSPWLGLPWGM